MSGRPSRHTPPGSAPRLSPAFLGLLVAVGFAARLAVLAVGLPPLTSDSAGYWEPAKSLAQGRGYLLEGQPSAKRPPTYPMFLALVILIAGPDPQRARIGQMLVTSLLGAGLAWWLDRRGAPRGAAAAAGMLVSLDPFLVAASALILTEALGAMLLTAFVLALHGAVGQPTWRRWGAVGFLAGALGLNIPNTLALLPFLLLWLALRRRPSPGLLLRWGLAAGLLVGCLGAWTVRNRLVLGTAIPVRSMGFTSLIWATTEYPFHWLPDPDDPEAQRMLERLAEISGGRQAERLHEVEGKFLREAWGNFRAHPGRVLARAAKANFWFWVEIPGAVSLLRPHAILRWTLLVFHQFQLLAFAVGVFLLARRAPSEYAFLGVGCVVYFGLSLMLMFPIPRYYVPVLPMLDLIAAIGVADWWQRGDANAPARPCAASAAS